MNTHTHTRSLPYVRTCWESQSVCGGEEGKWGEKKKVGPLKRLNYYGYSFKNFCCFCLFFFAVTVRLVPTQPNCLHIKCRFLSRSVTINRFFFFSVRFALFFFFLCFETFLQKSNGPEHFLSGMANRFHLEGAFSHPGNNCVPLNVLFRLYHLFFPPSENQDDWTTQWLCFNHLKA